MANAPRDAKYLVGTSNSTLTNEISAKSFITSGDIAGYGGAGTSEEYDTGTHGLTFSATPLSVDSNTTRKSHLYVSDNVNRDLYGTKTWTPAGAFDARCRLVVTSLAGGNYQSGLHIQDSTNANFLWLRIFGTTGSCLFRVQAFSFTASTYTQRGGDWSTTSDVYLRIIRDGSNNVTYYWSSDGFAWIFIATVSFTFTVNKIGYHSFIDNGAQYEYFVDWLRTDV